MTKSKIRPPRKPRGEDPKVTIANQERQITLLIDRVTALERDNRTMKQERDLVYNMAAHDKERVAQAEATHKRLLGWQDCAREMLELERTHISIPPEFREAE